MLKESNEEGKCALLALEQVAYLYGFCLSYQPTMLCHLFLCLFRQRRRVRTNLASLLAVIAAPWCMQGKFSKGRYDRKDVRPALISLCGKAILLILTFFTDLRGYLWDWFDAVIEQINQTQNDLHLLSKRSLTSQTAISTQRMRFWEQLQLLVSWLFRALGRLA